MTGSDKAQEILEAAETLAREGGYNGFSFREIAAAVGVKSASVHYHFPTKEDLGAAVAHRYTNNFLQALGDPATQGSGAAAIEKITGAFRSALVKDNMMCLCGVFGAEFADLPTMVRKEAKRFFELTLDWLTTALADNADPKPRAAHVLAVLEGAMILALTMGEPRFFEDAVSHLENV